MRTADGAIEKVAIDPETLEPTYRVIGDVKPVGICGSGMVDVVAGAFRNYIDLRPGEREDDRDVPRGTLGEDQVRWELSWNQSADGPHLRGRAGVHN